MICGGKGGGGGAVVCSGCFSFSFCILNGMKIILLLCCVIVEGILLWYYRGCIY